MPLDLVIANGTVATAADVFRADIGIQDGKIVQIGGDMGQARQTLDATDRYVLPGGIDSHVHIDYPSGPGVSMADDFDSAARAAAARPGRAGKLLAWAAIGCVRPVFIRSLPVSIR